jgi:hypothetical protein
MHINEHNMLLYVRSLKSELPNVIIIPKGQKLIIDIVNVVIWGKYKYLNSYNKNANIRLKSPDLCISVYPLSAYKNRNS